MRSIVKVERKRLLTLGIVIVFFAAVLLLSIYSSYQAVNSYEVWDMGLVASGKENLRHGRKHAERKKIEEAIAILREKEKAVFVGETNIEKLAALNYAGRNAEDLTDDEINQFLEKRLSIIEQSLKESSNFSYTEGEIENFMDEAGKLTGLTVGFAEGWKTLNRDLGDFIWLVLIMVSIIIMPLFAYDAQTRMKELTRSTKKGKRQLDLARVITAFETGSILYVLSIPVYFLIKMIPFGFSGSDEYIQSSEDTFFSVFHISYKEQFVWNCIRGYVSLLFVISITILISVILERMMAGIVIICFYWILLYIMEKMMSFEVNYIFANFMPLRLSGSMDFYVSNEIYRFAGKTFYGLVWCPAVALILSAAMAGASIWWMRLRSSMRI